MGQLEKIIRFELEGNKFDFEFKLKSAENIINLTIRFDYDSYSNTIRYSMSTSFCYLFFSLLLINLYNLGLIFKHINVLISIVCMFNVGGGIIGHPNFLIIFLEIPTFLQLLMCLFQRNHCW